MSEPVKTLDGPWIDEFYLKQLPKYDPELYSVRCMSAHTARLLFRTAFNMLLFLNQVVSYSIYGGRAWDTIAIKVLPDGKILLIITVQPRPEKNRMEVRFEPSS